jgi:hypothetical protein
LADGVAAEDDEDELPVVIGMLTNDWRGTRVTDCGDARTEERWLTD